MRRVTMIVALLLAALVAAGAYVRELKPSSFDAFGRLRVSEPYTLWESKFATDKRDDLWDEVTTGSGATATFNANQASVDLSVTATTAGSIRRQAHVRFPYQNGKSQLVVMTGTIGTTSPGNTKRWGPYDDQNGYFFEFDSTGLSVGIRSYTTGSVVDTPVAQASFNGSCAVAGYMTTFDEAMSQIFVIDYQWLGVGNVRFGVEKADGSFCLLHTVQNPNAIAGVYLSNPTLPISYEIINDGTGAADTFVQICSQLSSEAGAEFTGYSRAADTGITALTTASSTTRYPIVCVRLKSTHWRSSHVDIAGWSFFSDEAAQSMRAALVVNPTIAGTALSFSSVATESPVEAATPTNATTVTAEGALISCTFIATGNNSGAAVQSAETGSPLHIGVDPSGVSDIICVVAQNLTSNASDFYGSISWREIH